MKVSLIAAVAENYVIGKDKGLPWHLPADFKWFVKHTRKRTIVMGRRTLDTLDGQLPNRHHVIITRQQDYTEEGADVVHSPEEALEVCRERGDEEVMILGGATIYQALMPLADRFYLTVIHAKPEGDTYFPPVSPADWKPSYEEHYPADEKNPIPMTFYILERVASGTPAVPETLPQTWG